jgi:hypothetical protein
MWIVELLVVLFFIWLGARLGSIGIGFAGGFGVLVLAIVFGIKPGSIPVDVILIIMSVIAAIAAMQVAGGSGFHGPPGRKGAAQQSQVHHLHRTGGDLHHDHVCRDRADGIFHPAGHCRGGQGDRRATVTAAGHCHGGVPDCHYRIAHIGGGYFFRQ